MSPQFSLRYCDEAGRSEVVDFLAASDLAVTDVRIVERSSWPDAVAEHGSTAEAGTEIKEHSDAAAVDVLLQHQPDSGEPVELGISEESDGTRKMFALTGPRLDSLTRGNVLVLDELHDNLHPELVRFLVGQFHDPVASRHGAQLILSTHDTSILDRNLLRHDRIWLCARDERLETSVVSLSDFRTRQGEESLEPAYRAGRFGAVPYVRRSQRAQSDSD